MCYSDSRFGALAQLGERMAGSHEVRGSIPLCSTINSFRGRYADRGIFRLSRPDAADTLDRSI